MFKGKALRSPIHVEFRTLWRMIKTGAEIPVMSWICRLGGGVYGVQAGGVRT